MKAAPLIGISRHRLSTDGEGVTTLVAFHGCPLRRKYCLNPQSLHSEGIWKNYDCEQLYEEVRQDELYFLATNGLHSEAENLVYRAISFMNSVNSVDRNGSFP